MQEAWRRTKLSVSQRNSMRNSRRQTGFSLLELIIVLLVMVGLLALVWPNLQRPLNRTTLSEAAQTLRELIDESRYQAAMAGTPQFIHLRQGQSQVRSGPFEAFLEPSDQEFAGFDASSGGRETTLSSFDRPRIWELPPAVVISDVRWTLDAPLALPAGNAAEATPAEQAGQLALPAEGALGASEAEWWLPLLATGQGRDATIELYDTTQQQTLRVTYASATGALEVSR